MTGWRSAVTELRSADAEGEGCGSVVAAAGSETSLKNRRKVYRSKMINQTRKNPNNKFLVLALHNQVQKYLLTKHSNKQHLYSSYRVVILAAKIKPS